MNTIRAMSGADWNRALGIDRPEVKRIIEEASARLIPLLTKPCAVTEPVCCDADRSFFAFPAAERFDVQKVACA